MKFTRSTVVAALASTSAAAPLAPRAGITDGQILNYALTLEHLENAFYAGGLKNFTADQFAAAGFGAAFYSNLQTIAADEATHVSFLSGALKGAGVTPVSPCTYKFPYTSPKTFVALASILEGVGVSAYLGAAKSIDSKAYLTAAGSILTVESRHSAFIRNKLGEVPFAYPFDTPLDFDQVYTLAGSFIVSCPAPQITFVKAFPALAVANTTATPVLTGAKVTLSAPAATMPKELYAAWGSITGPIFTNITMSSSGQMTTVVPAGVSGQAYVVLNKNDKKVNDNTIIAGPGIIEIGAPVGT